MFEARNPVDGSLVSVHAGHGPAEVERRVGRLHDDFASWRTVPFPLRAERLRRVAAALRAEAAQLGELMAVEMGKPRVQGVAEANKCAWVCEFYADHAHRFLATETLPSDVPDSHVRHDPVGLVLAIMPWNFPLWQAFRFAAPALMAGNGVVLKHAPNVPGCALAIERLCTEADLPLTNLFVDVPDVGGLIADDRIAAVTLTGSTRAGASVAELAGRHLKKCVLELGGSDPFLVLADADLDAAARVGAASRLLNSGQSCIAAKRFVVDASVAEAFVDKLQAELAAAVVGDPLEPSTTVGPIARPDLRDALADQVARTEAAHRIFFDAPSGGCFHPVGLFVDPEPDSAAWTEELFGPVAAVRTFTDLDDAVRQANATVYGLGAAVFTADRATAMDLVPRLDAGAVFINGMVKSDPRLPFGGIKRSGYGRELSWHGIREFVNVRTVWATGLG